MVSIHWLYEWCCVVILTRPVVVLSCLLAGPVQSQPTTAPAPLQKLPVSEAAGIMGRPVRDLSGKNIGRIIDVVVDQGGQPRAAVIDFGGFLGVGDRRIAVDWNALHFAPGNQASPVTLDFTPDQIKAAPEYRESMEKPPSVVVPPTSAP
jgi:hypothetical protein